MKKISLSSIAIFTSLSLVLIFAPYSMIKTSDAANKKPAVKKVSPKKIKQGETSDISVKGKRFDNETGKSPTIKFSGKGITVNSVKFVNTKKITANITVSSSAKKNKRAIIVKNSHGKKCKKKKALKILKGSVSAGRSTVVFTNKSTYSDF